MAGSPLLSPVMSGARGRAEDEVGGCGLGKPASPDGEEDEPVRVRTCSLWEGTWVSNHSKLEQLSEKSVSLERKQVLIFAPI